MGSGRFRSHAGHGDTLAAGCVVHYLSFRPTCGLGLGRQTLLVAWSPQRGSKRAVPFAGSDEIRFAGTSIGLAMMEASDTNSPEMGSAVEAGVGQATSPPRRVLVVDDDPAIVLLLQRYLSNAGYDVLTASDGADALPIVQAEHPAIILTDYSMSQMTGVELVRRVRAEKGLGFIYVIMVTAESDKARLVEAFDAGADDFITKPVNKQELLARLRAGERMLRLEAETLERQRLQFEKNRLKEAVAALEQVLSVVAHELRTPIASIRATSELLLTTHEALKESDGSQEEFITSIHSQIIRMSDVVANMLEVARLNSGLATWDWSQFQMRAPCEEVIALLHKDDSSQITLTYHVRPDDLSMWGDVGAIRRMLKELLVNACRHAGSRTVKLLVEEVREQGVRCIEIRVQDQGQGISPEVVKRLGTAFALSSGISGAQYVQGSGFGLAICKGIVAAHGGSIRIESSQGQGTTVLARIRADLSGPVQAGQQSDSLSAVCI